MVPLKNWLRRRRIGAAALALYAVLAMAMMAPLASKELPVTPAHDICNHVSGIVEAKNALREGQFPLRVAPRQCNNERYAFFQFYGNFPYTLGGALYRVSRASPYTVLKAVIAGFVVVGGFFTYRASRVLTRQALPSLAAGVVFVTAPYLLTDIHGRVAFPEIVSFGLLPAVFYFAWRCFAGRGLGPVLASGLAWCLLALSHNITFLYGSLYIGLFFLSYLAPRRRLLVRWSRVGAGYALGWLLAAWYLVPQQMLLPDLVSGLVWPVQDWAWLTPLGVLLAPSLAVPVGPPDIKLPDHFGLQIGWLTLTAVGLVIYGFFQPRAGSPSGRGHDVRLLLFFGIAFFMTWSPLDFWSWLPRLLCFVQFAYRLLMFVALFGSILAAFALAQLFRGRMQVGHLALLVLVAGLCASPYLSPQHGDKALSVEKEIATPDVGRGGATYWYRPGAACLLATTLVHADMDWADPGTGGVLDRIENRLFGKHWGAFPTLVAGDRLMLQGTVLAGATDPLRLTIVVDDAVVATRDLCEGPFELTLPLPPTPGKDRVRIMVQGKLQARPSEPLHNRSALYTLSRFALLPAAGRPPEVRLISEDQVFRQMHWGQPTSLKLHLTQASLVQLPVLYYPRLLRIENHGQPVAVEHLGRRVALLLPAGDHEIRVRLAGVGWANGVSLVAWIAAMGGAWWLGASAWWRLASRRTAAKRSPAPPLPRGLDGGGATLQGRGFPAPTRPTTAVRVLRVVSLVPRADTDSPTADAEIPT